MSMFPIPEALGRSRGRRASFSTVERRPCTSGRRRSRELVASAAGVPPGRSAELGALLETYNDWDFDIFALAELSASPLVISASEAMHRADVFASLGVREECAHAFLLAISRGYRRSNAYHNQLHAADVTQSMHHLISECELLSGTGPLSAPAAAASSSSAAEASARPVAGNVTTAGDCEAAAAAARGGGALQPHVHLAAVLAAAVHDVAHPGVNNAFLVATRSTLALRYNDRSPLENMHAATAFELMSSAKRDVLAPLGEPLRSECRRAMIEMVLATDNAHHHTHLAALTRLVTAAAAGPGGGTVDAGSAAEDQLAVLRVALHAADVANPAKAWRTCRAWTERVMEEFFAQGDAERARGLPVSRGMDRTDALPLPAFQRGFIDFVCLPVFECLGRVGNVEHCVARLRENRERWGREEEEGCGGG